MGSRILKQDIIAQLNYLNGLHRYRNGNGVAQFDNEASAKYNEAISILNQGKITSSLIDKINSIFWNKSACRVTNFFVMYAGGSGKPNGNYGNELNYMNNRSKLSVPSGRIYESYFNAIKASISNLANCHCYSNCHNNCHSNCESTSGCKDGR